MDGWMDGWMDDGAEGRMVWMDGRLAGLRVDGCGWMDV